MWSGEEARRTPTRGYFVGVLGGVQAHDFAPFYEFALGRDIELKEGILHNQLFLLMVAGCNFHLPKLVVYARPTSCIETEIGAVRPRSNALPIPRSIVTRGHEQRRRG
jgi:hypothetical protein